MLISELIKRLSHDYNDKIRRDNPIIIDIGTESITATVANIQFIFDEDDRCYKIIIRDVDETDKKYAREYTVGGLYQTTEQLYSFWGDQQVIVVDTRNDNKVEYLLRTNWEFCTYVSLVCSRTCKRVWNNHFPSMSTNNIVIRYQNKFDQIRIVCDDDNGKVTYWRWITDDYSIRRESLKEIIDEIVDQYNELKQCAVSWIWVPDYRQNKPCSGYLLIQTPS